MQHVSSWLTRGEYDAVMERQRAAGVVVAHEGEIAASGVRFAYFATDASPVVDVRDRRPDGGRRSIRW
jgi:hypothetical protein